MRLMLYDSWWSPYGVLQAVTDVSGKVVENGQSVLSFTVDGDVSYVELLSEPGVRFELYDGLDLIGGYELEEATITLPERISTIEVTAIGYDGALLDRLLSHPDPTTQHGPNTEIVFTKEYDHRSGPFETVAKGLIRDAAARQTEPVTVAPDLGRGPTVTVDARAVSLADLLWPLADRAGMSIRVSPNPNHYGYLVDVVPRRVLPGTLTDGPGPLTSGKLTIRRPLTSGVLVGGKGEGAARTFLRVDATDGRDTDWGIHGEMFRDARDAKDAATLIARGEETLAETAASYGLSLNLAEVDGFRWRDGYDVGDVISVDVSGLPYRDWVRRVEWSWKAGNGPGTGFSARPIVGDHKGQATAELVASIANMQRNDRIGKAAT